MKVAICTSSLACKSVALEKTGNNPHTYNCVELYMASPLEKSRELAVLIITQDMDCPVLCCVMAPAGQRAVIGEGVKRGRI